VEEEQPQVNQGGANHDRAVVSDFVGYPLDALKICAAHAADDLKLGL